MQSSTRRRRNDVQARGRGVVRWLPWVGLLLRLTGWKLKHSDPIPGLPPQYPVQIRQNLGDDKLWYVVNNAGIWGQTGFRTADEAACYARQIVIDPEGTEFRRNQPDPEQLAAQHGFAVETAQRIITVVTEYNALVDAIDAAYNQADFSIAAQLEERAEELRNELEGLYHELEFGAEEFTEREPGTQEELAAVYGEYLAGRLGRVGFGPPTPERAQAELLRRLRGVVERHGRLRAQSDKWLLKLAQESFERRRAHIERFQAMRERWTHAQRRKRIVGEAEKFARQAKRKRKNPLTNRERKELRALRDDAQMMAQRAPDQPVGHFHAGKAMMAEDVEALFYDMPRHRLRAERKARAEQLRPTPKQGQLFQENPKVAGHQLTRNQLFVFQNLARTVQMGYGTETAMPSTDFPGQRRVVQNLIRKGLLTETSFYGLDYYDVTPAGQAIVDALLPKDPGGQGILPGFQENPRSNPYEPTKLMLQHMGDIKCTMIVAMRPGDFLNATSEGVGHRLAIEREAQPLAVYNQAAAEGKTALMPMLCIRVESRAHHFRKWGPGGEHPDPEFYSLMTRGNEEWMAKVVSHEGRHRAAATAAAGERYVAVAICVRSDDPAWAKHIDPKESYQAGYKVTYEQMAEAFGWIGPESKWGQGFFWNAATKPIVPYVHPYRWGGIQLPLRVPNPIPAEELGRDCRFKPGELSYGVTEVPQPAGGMAPGAEWQNTIIVATWATTESLQRIVPHRELAEWVEAHPDAVYPESWKRTGKTWWIRVGVIQLVEDSHDPGLWGVFSSAVPRQFRGLGLGLYLYSAAADAAAKRGGKLASLPGERSGMAEQLWESQRLRKHYAVEYEDRPRFTWQTLSPRRENGVQTTTRRQGNPKRKWQGGFESPEDPATFHLMAAVWDVRKARELIRKREREGYLDIGQLNPKAWIDMFGGIIHIEPERVAAIDLEKSPPVIVAIVPDSVEGHRDWKKADDAGAISHMVIDGWHRMKKATELGVTELPAIVLNWKESYDVRLDPGKDGPVYDEYEDDEGYPDDGDGSDEGDHDAPEWWGSRRGLDAGNGNGAPGGRRFNPKERPQRIAALRVPCPHCQAAPGEPCRSLVSGRPYSPKGFHAARTAQLRGGHPPRPARQHTDPLPPRRRPFRNNPEEDSEDEWAITDADKQLAQWGLGQMESMQLRVGLAPSEIGEGMIRVVDSSNPEFYRKFLEAYQYATHRKKPKTSGMRQRVIAALQRIIEGNPYRRDSWIGWRLLELLREEEAEEIGRYDQAEYELPDDEDLPF